MTRIVFIGAGSVEFTRNLLGDILTFPELADATIVLHDINAERLETAAAMARWTNGAVGGRATIETHLDRRAALDGADFAINTIEVGGIAATRLDFDIPEKYGLRQTIGDTLGVGAVFRALRTIPVLLDIGSDMAELCPDAWLLNYTNPMAMNIWAYDAGSPHKKVVGLCHSIQNTSRQISEYVGVPFDEVTFAGAGVNHMAWVLRFERKGVDLYPLLDEAIAADPDGLGRHVRVQVYKLFGYFPTESSEHFAEYVPWFMRDDAEIDRLRIPVREYIARSEENIGFYEQEKRMLAAGEPFEIERSLEYASLIIHSMVTGTERGIYGNVPNRVDGGAGRPGGGSLLIGNLPADAAVEVPCLVDRTGVRPVAMGDLPPQCAALDRSFLNVADLTVRGALEGRRDHILQAVLLDPNAGATLSAAHAGKLVDEMLAAHRDLLPEALR
ncbi:MAG: alpha-galactosidase [Thermoleophilia bacterium]